MSLNVSTDFLTDPHRLEFSFNILMNGHCSEEIVQLFSLE